MLRMHFGRVLRGSAGPLLSRATTVPVIDGGLAATRRRLISTAKAVGAPTMLAEGAAVVAAPLEGAIVSTAGQGTGRMVLKGGAAFVGGSLLLGGAGVGLILGLRGYTFMDEDDYDVEQAPFTGRRRVMSKQYDLEYDRNLAGRIYQESEAKEEKPAPKFELIKYEVTPQFLEFATWINDIALQNCLEGMFTWGLGSNIRRGGLAAALPGGLVRAMSLIQSYLLERPYTRRALQVLLNPLELQVMLINGHVRETVFIVAHEMAHIVLRHVSERRALLELSQEVFGLGGDQEDDTFTTKCLRELSVLVLLPLIREPEHEADEVAMLLLAQARVDPTIAIDALKQLADHDPEFVSFSTHPTAQQRVARARERLPEAMEIYEQRMREKEEEGKADDA